MPRPIKKVENDAEFQSAHTIRNRLGISETTVRNLALAGRVRVKTAESIINLYSVDDVREALERQAQQEGEKLKTQAAM